ncbi:MAG: fatty acid oxidation complex subunit alpha FadB [Kistimonas sp.]|nr:fatty acid oxidation complex subunit alpha FadB [Kistimonas sp.]
MIYEGHGLAVSLLDDGIAQLDFSPPRGGVNLLDQPTLLALDQALTALHRVSDLAGLVLTSSADSFIAGADIKAFNSLFSQSEETICQYLAGIHQTFNALEDLAVPTVAAVNGLALGGGFELCLAADYRILSSQASVGLPEVRLGIFPGFGGVVRLSRLVGCDTALEWICQGLEQQPDAALRAGAVDAVVKPEHLLTSALDTLQRAGQGALDWHSQRQRKIAPVTLPAAEQTMVFATAEAMVAAKAGPHCPAPLEALRVMRDQALLARHPAQQLEAQAFARVARTTTAAHLIQLFMNDQLVKKKAAQYAHEEPPTRRAAILGAGIMGGGIACQSALAGIPVLMKDVAQQGLDLGLEEAALCLNRRLERGKLSPLEMGRILNRIAPTLNYGDFAQTDLVVEAVVEDKAIKQAVLKEVEQHVRPGTLLTSNTSTIPIAELAGVLERPQDFCGLHFFNPVHKMPLVEVIRGPQTSQEALARAVCYAKSLRKTPIVVSDCPGFLVNRVLFPYLGGFAALVRDGFDFREIDRVMEGFGWPMGPARLLDIVGLDTAIHAETVMACGFPERMGRDFTSALEALHNDGRLGQKNGLGFYRYEADKKGRLRHHTDEKSLALVASCSAARRETFEDREILERMMIPLCLEQVRCLEDGTVATAAEADMALVLGLGFPPFRQGPLGWIQAQGLKHFLSLCDRHAPLGPLYAATEELRRMVHDGKTFY